MNIHSKHIERCYELAKRSTCSKAQYGSVVVTFEDGMQYPKILGEGWNTSPNPACNDCATHCAGGIRSGVKSGTRAELCYATHAEQWAILRAGKCEGALVYCAGYWGSGQKSVKVVGAPRGEPSAGFYCSICARTIWAAGCSGVVCDYSDGIPRFQSLVSMWETSYATAGSELHEIISYRGQTT